jgi:O-acetyl-ADP-ribose deacetylase (regulator of RNase III)
MKYQEIDGDLLKLALDGNFDVITHGCNCFCTMGSGIAPQFADKFGADKFPKEDEKYKGDINKLGTIDSKTVIIDNQQLVVVNSYTQYFYGKSYATSTDLPLNYSALSLCLKKINHLFGGKKIGLPKIGCGLAGGDWDIVKKIIKTELSDCYITIVNYKK